MNQFTWDRYIEETLKGMPQEMEAPKDFSQQVMARIEAEQVRPLTVASPALPFDKISSTVSSRSSGSTVSDSKAMAAKSSRPFWKQWVAAAAAFALLAGGTGAYVAFQDGLSPSPAGHRAVALGGEAAEEMGDRSVGTDGVGTLGFGIDPDTSIGSDGVVGMAGSGVNGEGSAGGGIVGSGSGADADPSTSAGSGSIAGTSGAAGSYGAAGDGASAASSDGGSSASMGDQRASMLLSQKKTVERAFYRYQVSDLEYAAGLVKTNAVALGGVVAEQSLQEVQDRRMETVILRIPHNRSAELLPLLGALGTPVERRSDTQDITNRYQETVAHLQYLQSQVGQATSSDLVALQSKIASLERQLRAWDQESASVTVVVTLEIAKE
ncbi:DUF4349 domain-containing protein [Heliorestis convoluta]|uniref:DUF4349 domain-containing protein n=1 Tax=Heliorestis convoluta TaxID=356322 RepID=A0A5Q2N0V3_9FIRM|nr:DUF4349 domain-containing protein [Heliorestis convoluta]QGG47186.1 hypothetical protein FTV88_1034 [Heliorestis convoluta]